MPSTNSETWGYECPPTFPPPLPPTRNHPNSPCSITITVASLVDYLARHVQYNTGGPRHRGLHQEPPSTIRHEQRQPRTSTFPASNANTSRRHRVSNITAPHLDEATFGKKPFLIYQTAIHFCTTMDSRKAFSHCSVFVVRQLVICCSYIL